MRSLRLFFIVIAITGSYFCADKPKASQVSPDGCCAVFRDSLTTWIRNSGKLPSHFYQFAEDSVILTLSEPLKHEIWPNLLNDKRLDTLGKTCGFSITQDSTPDEVKYRFIFFMDPKDTSFSIPCDLLLFMFKN